MHCACSRKLLLASPSSTTSPASCHSPCFASEFLESHSGHASIPALAQHLRAHHSRPWPNPRVVHEHKGPLNALHGTTPHDCKHAVSLPYSPGSQRAGQQRPRQGGPLALCACYARWAGGVRCWLHLSQQLLLHVLPRSGAWGPAAGQVPDSYLLHLPCICLPRLQQCKGAQCMLLLNNVLCMHMRPITQQLQLILYQAKQVLASCP